MSPRTVRPCNYPTGPTTPTDPPVPLPPAAPTISNFVVGSITGGPPAYLPGGHFTAGLSANITNATTASYVAYLVSSPTTVVTGTQNLFISGTNYGSPGTQLVTIDPSATSPNIILVMDVTDPSGPYIVTLTATGPGGSVSQTIDNVNIYY